VLCQVRKNNKLYLSCLKQYMVNRNLHYRYLNVHMSIKN